ncbi:hypothetical protein O6H91_Y141100 [Diphasiastrum complanatum]|nr:hypothetical protein O6H91_Y141100 [Diphasiastrum complanatum]
MAEIREKVCAGESEATRGCARRRLERLASHLHASSHLLEEAQLSRSVCSRVTVKRPLNSAALSTYMAGEYSALRDKIVQFFLERPSLLTPVEIAKDEHRELTMRQVLAVVRECGIRPLQYLLQEPGKYFAVTEAVGLVDLSLGIKLGVQFR